MIIRSGGVIHASDLFIDGGSAKIVVEEDASIYADGYGYGAETGDVDGFGPGHPPEDSIAGGAGHAGLGGVAGTSGFAGASVRGTVYGDISKPATMGSCGIAFTNPYGGDGGGIIKIVATATHTQSGVKGNVKIDGIVTARGLSPSRTEGGGGSGGSIWIDTIALSGRGKVDASGGNGQGGGGAGGLMKISYTQASSRWAGQFRATGGEGYEAGAAGLQLESKTIVVPFVTLRADNEGLPFRTNNIYHNDLVNLESNPATTFLTYGSDDPAIPGSGVSVYEYDAIDLRGNARVGFIGRDRTGAVSAASGVLVGDGTGVLHIAPKQSCALGDESGDIPLKPKAGVWVAPAATLLLPKNVTLLEITSKWDFSGRIDQLAVMHVEAGTTLQLGATGFTNGASPGTYGRGGGEVVSPFDVLDSS